MDILSVVIEEASAAAADGICDEDRCFNALQHLKQNLLAHEDPFSVIHQVENCIRQLAKHPQKRISCLASDVHDMCKSKLDSRLTEELKTVELHGPKSSIVNPSVAIMKPAEALKSEPYESGSEKWSIIKACNFSTACSKLERPDEPYDIKGENSKTRESTENVNEPFEDENSPEEKKHDETEKNTIPVGGGVVPKLNSLPLTHDKARDQVREIVAEALCKVSTEVVNDDDLLKQVNACDPYRTAAMLETITFEKWGTFDGPEEYKYRCLLLHLKDPNNPDFRRDILLGQLPVDCVADFTREDMCSEERVIQMYMIEDVAPLELPCYSKWSTCSRHCKCKYPESVRRAIRLQRRGLNTGHRGWKRIGCRKKHIARGSKK